MPQPPSSARAVGLLFAAAALLAAIMWLAATSDGVVARCERLGGHFLAGPAGETVCLDRKTFLPLEGFREN